MVSFTSASSFLFILSGVVTADVAKPLGLYTPRNYTTASISAELEFLENDRVKYNIRSPMLDSKSMNSYPIAMISSSLIRVTVDEQQQQYWEQYHPGQFSREGYTVFGYDPVKNRVTMVATGDAFEVLHESDPAEDAGPVTDVTKPSGVYRVQDGGLSMTMEFKQVGGRDRVHYHIRFGERDYSSLLDPAFLMLSSSMVRVELSESDLFRLHGRFPGLSRDFFYMNLGYDPVADVITFVLDSYLGVNLVHSPTTTPLLRNGRP
ncbi:hypothetical protein FOZ60_006805 [Perkinsus olseni]|uniref:Uncharacterized protein n=1 Tax=Perkinsus olseni TaxID=32597 RepID=A0A7J6NNC8_PEROL|nr:hypothetical protein FOZ60_006805 [Perkinsus olseni]